MKYRIISLMIILYATVSHADDTCGDGYTLMPTDSSSTVATRGGECYSGYEIYSGSNFRFIPQDTGIVCPYGQHMSGGTCVADTIGDCATGFHDADMGTVTAVQTLGGECYSGYQPQQTNRNVAYLIVSPNPPCGSGYYQTPNGCVAHTIGDCATGFHDTDMNSASAVQTLGGECYSGYQVQQTNRNVAYLIVSPNPPCGSGYYPTPNGCVAYTTGDCMENYYAISPTNAFVRASDDTCPTNYAMYNDTEICKSWPAFIDKPDFCTPQLLCDAGVTSLRSNTGMILPIYREKLTTPSLNARFENGKTCYLNTISGNGVNTINLRYNNETYHGVE